MYVASDSCKGLELLAIAVALCTWTDLLQQADLVVFSDNTGAACDPGSFRP
jgi:hypothetical protein